MKSMYIPPMSYFPSIHASNYTQHAFSCFHDTTPHNYQQSHLAVKLDNKSQASKNRLPFQLLRVLDPFDGASFQEKVGVRLALACSKQQENVEGFQQFMKSMQQTSENQKPPIVGRLSVVLCCRRNDITEKWGANEQMRRSKARYASKQGRVGVLQYHRTQA